MKTILEFILLFLSIFCLVGAFRVEDGTYGQAILAGLSVMFVLETAEMRIKERLKR